jgi:REP element-mobilizing transposase RayT
LSRNKRDIFFSDQMYHIYNRVVSGSNLFIEKDDYWNFMERYTKYFSPYFKTYAYCLIPNHFHLLIKVRNEDKIKLFASTENTTAARNYMNGSKDLNSFLENQFSRCFSGIAIIYNNKHNRVGPLFKQGVKRVALNDYRTFDQQMHYIHLNPVHHYQVKNIEEWPYSSYYTYISSNKTQLPRKEVFEHFGGKDYFIAFHQKPYIGDIDFE